MSDYSCRHEAEPKAALEALVHHDGSLLLDLDDTAYLRNSTEDFLDTPSPGLPALLLLRLFDAIRPWVGRAEKPRANYGGYASAVARNSRPVICQIIWLVPLG